MRIFIFIAALSLSAMICRAQKDSLILNNVNFKKVIRFADNGVSMLVSLSDLQRYLLTLRKTVYDKPYLKERYKAISNVLTELGKAKRRSDTIMISTQQVNTIGKDNFMLFLGGRIENNNIIIFDETNARQTKIIRERVTEASTTRGGWSGKLFYLPNQKNFFLKCITMYI